MELDCDYANLTGFSMASDRPTASYESGRKIDNPTTANWLADAHDVMMSVSVPLPNGRSEQRDYEVHLPNGMTSIPADKPLPVVFALDGTTANKPYSGMAVDNNLNAEADRDGFMVVYPLPKPRSEGLTVAGLNTGIAGKTVRDWNAPGVGSLPTDNSYNDADYLKQVIGDVRAKFHPDRPIDVASMSLGGEFLAKLNSDLPPGTFGREYIVSSTVFGTEGSQANASGASVKMVRGDNDPILPQYGRMHQDFPFFKDLVMRGVEATNRTDHSCPPCMTNELLDANHFSGSTPLPVNMGTYTEQSYSTPTGARIVVDTVHDAGHFWFGVQTGGSHATVATDSNGHNPPASAFDATSDMARWFGLRKD